MTEEVKSDKEKIEFLTNALMKSNNQLMEFAKMIVELNKKLEVKNGNN